MCKDRRGKETRYLVRLLPAIRVIWRANVQPKQIADYRREVGDYNSRQQVGSHEEMVREDEDSGPA